MNDYHVPNHTFIEKIGAGGMGVVYKAWDQKIKRYVAVKILSLDYMQNKLQYERFRREILAISKLKHPNIISLYQFGETETYCFYTMPYIDGQKVTDYIRSQKLHLPKIIDIFCEICEALAFIHQKGIVHRDLKPDNILVDKMGKVFVMDFGLAKLSDEKALLTKSDQIMGTLNYMSPEQIASSKRVNIQSDIYSLGVILYQMITSSLPYNEGPSYQIVYQILNKPPLPHPNLSKELQVICCKAMAKQPKLRYRKVKYLVLDLQKTKENKRNIIPFFSVYFDNVWLYKHWIFFGSGILLCCFLFLGYLQKANDKNLHVKIGQDSVPLDIAKNLFNNGLFSEAKKHITKIIDSQGNSEKVDTLWLSILYELKEHNTIIDYSGAYKNTKIDTIIAKTYYILEKYDNTLEILRNIANTEKKMEQEITYYKALSFYQKAKKETEPENVKFFQETISLLEPIGVNYLDTNIKQNGILYLGLAFLSIGKIKNNKEDIKKAMMYMESVQEKLSYSVLLWSGLAEGYAFLGNNKEEERCLYECCRLDNSNPEYWAKIGKTLVNRKEYELAYHRFRKSLEIDPSFIPALEGIAEVAYWYPFDKENIFYTIFHSLNNIKLQKKFDLLQDDINKIVRTYETRYHEWLSTKDNLGNPIPFLEAIAKNEQYDAGVKGLFSLRYQPSIIQEIDFYIERQSLEDSQKLIQIRNSLVNEIVNAKKQTKYYFLAHFYLYDTIQIRTELAKQIDELKQIFWDTQEVVLLRYLAAKALVSLLHNEVVIETFMQKQDPTSVAISFCVLRESGFVVDHSEYFVNVAIENEWSQFFFLRAISHDPIFFSELDEGNQDFYLLRSSKVTQWILNLLASPNEKIRIMSACVLWKNTNNLQKVVYAKIKEQLSAYLWDKSIDINLRLYVHFYYWAKPSNNTEDDVNEYLRVFKEEEEIVFTALWYFYKFNHEETYLCLENLIDNKNSFRLSLKAIYAICSIDPFSKNVTRIVRNESLPWIHRILASCASIVFQIYYAENQKMTFLKTFTEIRDNANEILANNYSYGIKSMTYTLFTFLSHHPLHFLSHETNQDDMLKKHMIAGVCSDTFLNSYVRGFIDLYTKKEKWDYIKAYESYAPLIMPVSMAKIFLAEEKDHKNLFEEAIQSNNIEIKKGAALGFYRLMYFDIQGDIRFGSKLKGGTPEDIYFNFLMQLEKTSGSKKKAQKYILWLSYTIELLDDNVQKARYLFERAIIFRQQNQKEKALANIKEALIIVTKNIKSDNKNTIYFQKLLIYYELEKLLVSYELSPNEENLDQVTKFIEKSLFSIWEIEVLKKIAVFYEKNNKKLELINVYKQSLRTLFNSKNYSQPLSGYKDSVAVKVRLSELEEESLMKQFYIECSLEVQKLKY